MPRVDPAGQERRHIRRDSSWADIEVGRRPAPAREQADAQRGDDAVEPEQRAGFVVGASELEARDLEQRLGPARGLGRPSVVSVRSACSAASRSMWPEQVRPPRVENRIPVSRATAPLLRPSLELPTRPAPGSTRSPIVHRLIPLRKSLAADWIGRRHASIGSQPSGHRSPLA